MPKRRGHNEGSWYQVPSGAWRAAITVHHPDGRVTRKYCQARTKQAVQRAVRAFKDREREGQPAAGPTLTLGQFLERWLREDVATHNAPGTHAAYGYEVKRVLPHLG